MKEENARKKVKLNQENVQNQLAIEKSTSPENNGPENKNTVLASPSKDAMVEETIQVVKSLETPKKIDNRALSKFLNPKIDLQNYSTLSAFIRDYQSQQIELRAKNNLLASSHQPPSNKSEKSIASCKNIVSDVKEQYLLDQQFSLKTVTGKFAEYLERRKHEGNYKTVLELLKDFKH